MEKIRDKRVEELKKLFELYDFLESQEIEKSDMFDFHITPPYSTGKRNEPVKWDDSGLQSKLP